MRMMQIEESDTEFEVVSEFLIHRNSKRVMHFGYENKQFVRWILPSSLAIVKLSANLVVAPK